MQHRLKRTSARPISLAICLVISAGLFALSGSILPDSATVTIRLIDGDTGRPLAGVIQIELSDGKRLPLPELLSRGIGLPGQAAISEWSVLTKPSTLELPRQKLTVRAFSGLETELTTTDLDLTQAVPRSIDIPLRTLNRSYRSRWVSGNTHLHLRNMSRADSDRYLREIPAADGLDVLFVSYLERAEADKTYISNEYRSKDLQQLATGLPTKLGHGEEHRHNDSAGGQGYGHVMLLDLSELILPVSIGPGIMQTGTDGLPLQRGIEQARRDGGTILWCHNAWGTELLPNIVAGSVDAQNMYDGGHYGNVANSYYRLLEAGISVPLSTGTDWFMYDFSRVYCRLEGDVTLDNWIAALKSGQTTITNGPLLDLKVNNSNPGERLSLKRPGQVTVEATAIGRIDFRTIELVHNGKVIESVASRPVGKHFEADMSLTLDIEEPGWLALRIPPPTGYDNSQPREQRQITNPLNEYGQELFAHTSAIAIEIDGRRRRQAEVLRELLAEIVADRKTVDTQGKFDDEQERARVLDVYNAAIEKLQLQLNSL
ncbi:MAG TPA: CehA/McbA family metallohydrolase [Planctomycetaceae bacterium]|nr:CehA/McbA family metallohydrolase [Planctomycetaceae bacterium]